MTSLLKLLYATPSFLNFRFWLLSPAVFFLTSCSLDNEEDLFADEICLTNEVSYSGTIKPLIDNNCIACHNSSLPSGNINLEDYNHLKPLLENGRFLESISHSPGFFPMPKGGPKLSDCDISKVEKWIEEGFPNN